MPQILTKNQWRYIQHWLILIIAFEILMVAFNSHLPGIYLSIAFLFFGGFVLRAVEKYPGKEEPLILDASGVLIALLMAYMAKVIGISNLRFILILCSSAIVLPHFAYIISNKDIV